jgi:phosphatidylglycerophosphate synthase
MLGPVARGVPERITPIAITMAGLVVGLGAAVTAGMGLFWIAVGLWLLNRLLDGIDGTLARLRGRQTDFGGYVDLLADFVVYAAIPIGVAAHLGTIAAWIAASALLATFYVNTISWSFLSAVLARRGREGSAHTSIAMPGGLVEGAETVVLFTLILAMPGLALALMWIMAGAVALTALQRLAWAYRTL